MEERAEPAVEIATRRKAVLAATIGNFVEWYDFTIYLYFATVISILLRGPLTFLIGAAPTYEQVGPRERCLSSTPRAQNQRAVSSGRDRPGSC